MEGEGERNRREGGEWEMRIEKVKKWRREEQEVKNWKESREKKGCDTKREEIMVLRTVANIYLINSYSLFSLLLVYMYIGRVDL